MYIVSFPGRRPRIDRKIRFQIPAVPLAMACGDIDGDGIPDPIAIAIEVEVKEEVIEIIYLPPVLELFSSKLSIPECFTRIPLGDSPWPFSGLAVGDVTGDGKADVVFSLTTGHGAYILPGKGDWTFFGEGTKISQPLGPLFVSDIDGNGQTDLIASTLGFSPEIVIRFNGGER